MIPFVLTTCEASEERRCDAVSTARRVHSRPLPSLRTTGLAPAQGVLQVPASRVAQRCSHCSERASSKRWTVSRPQRETAQAICRRRLSCRWGVSRSPRLSHRTGLAGDCKDRLANGKAALVLHTNGGGCRMPGYRIISSDNHIFEP